MIELYKIKQNIFVPIMENMFQVKDNTYNINYIIVWDTQKKRTINYGIGVIDYSLSVMAIFA